MRHETNGFLAFSDMDTYRGPITNQAALDQVQDRI